MKQGPSSSRPGDRKAEPKPKAVSVGHVQHVGLQYVPAKGKALEPMYKSQGYKAPMSTTTRHKPGSQGKR